MIGVQDGTTGYIYCSSPVEDGGYGEDHVTSYTNGAMAIEALKAGKMAGMHPEGLDECIKKAIKCLEEALKVYPGRTR